MRGVDTRNQITQRTAADAARAAQDARNEQAHHWRPRRRTHGDEQVTNLAREQEERFVGADQSQPATDDGRVLRGLSSGQADRARGDS